MNKSIPNKNSCNDFLLKQKYQDFIISSWTLHNENGYYSVLHLHSWRSRSRIISYKLLIFFKNKITRILLFLVKYYTIKMHIILALSPIDLMSRVFASGPGGGVSIPGRVIPKTRKMVLDVALFSSQYYEVGIKSKVGQPRKLSSALPYTSV